MTADPAPGTVVVVGTGRAGAPVDTLVLDVRLEGHGATVAQALDALGAASRACSAALADVPLRTSGLAVHPRHDHRTGAVVGHTALQSLRLRTADPAGAGALVQRLSSAAGDALVVDGLRGELSDPGAVQGRARELAFEDARARAEQYAALAGRAVVALRHVREVADGPGQPFPRAEARMAMDTGPVVEAADHEVVVSVEVTWELSG